MFYTTFVKHREHLFIGEKLATVRYICITSYWGGGQSWKPSSCPHGERGQMEAVALEVIKVSEACWEVAIWKVTGWVWAGSGQPDAK
jgi:hypothetical protein